ncbi:protein of unknown function [Anaerovirgula multivorans]|uniref:DUF3298 domain-containing protein n=1 Tax=Anaerovirgula multivorans TaxID=312168 RepID=A0A239H3Z6_9FIRM|nr:DUF3298 and DUF4163 domain-containing protein [Anaerovirgula multivorans]SNS75885.1 protein of unknown function [Anaerovirgula multivorans]
MIKEEGKAKIEKRKLIRHRIGLTYPDIIGLDNEDIQQAINGTIQEEIYKMIIEQGYEEDYTKEIWGDYKVELNEYNLLSVLIYIHSYSKGAAHGLTALKAINFDLQSGKTYELADLFIKNSGYVNKINELIKEEMVEKDIPMLVEFETIDKKQDFYLTKEALTVFFQLYEYTPYAYGIPEFGIPYNELEDIVNKQGPLKFIATSK